MTSRFFTRIKGRYQRSVAAAFFTRKLALQSDVSYISFTFDDFPRSALRQGGAILAKFGLHATYYASFGLINTVSETGQIFIKDDVRELLRSGHELGCHTFSHCDSWSTRPDAFEASIIKNQRMFDALVDG